MGLRKQAIKSNEATYFTGKPCKNGHTALRRTVNGVCIVCEKIFQRNHDSKPNRKEAHKERSAERRKIDPEKVRSQVLKSQSKNPEKYAALYAAHCAKRRALQLQRTPVWADFEKIKEVYRAAQDLDGEYHVDHIIPLCGDLVSGLHVSENLQILTASENVKKWKHFSV